MRGVHELRGDAELAVRAQHRKGGDVAVHLGGVLVELGQHVAHDLAVALRHVQQLGPRERVVQVIFHLVVLGEAHQIAVLIFHRSSSVRTDTMATFPMTRASSESPE